MFDKYLKNRNITRAKLVEIAGEPGWDPKQSRSQLVGLMIDKVTLIYKAGLSIFCCFFMFFYEFNFLSYADQAHDWQEG